MRRRKRMEKNVKEEKYYIAADRGEDAYTCICNQLANCV